MLKTFKDYQKWANELFGLGYIEIGGVICEDGKRRAGITISNKMEYEDGNEVYQVIINKKVLKKLVEAEENNE